jgi:rhodanese-related sulfurtransferase
MKTRWMILMMGLLGLSACGADVPVKISQEDLLKRQADKVEFLLLDVRSAPEFQQGTIAGSTWMPHGEVAARLAELEKFKDKAIIVYCQSGVRSGKAIKVLKANGFAKAVQLDGDYGAWVRAGRPVVKP